MLNARFCDLVVPRSMRRSCGNSLSLFDCRMRRLGVIQIHFDNGRARSATIQHNFVLILTVSRATARSELNLLPRR